MSNFQGWFIPKKPNNVDTSFVLSLDDAIHPISQTNGELDGMAFYQSVTYASNAGDVWPLLNGEFDSANSAVSIRSFITWNNRDWGWWTRFSCANLKDISDNQTKF